MVMACFTARAHPLTKGLGLPWTTLDHTLPSCCLVRQSSDVRQEVTWRAAVQCGPARSTRVRATMAESEHPQ
jgi:hypothetical protein